MGDDSGFVDVVIDNGVACRAPERKSRKHDHSANHSLAKPADQVVPPIVKGIIALLVPHNISQYRGLVRAHVSDEALDAAISRLRAIREAQ